MSKIYAMALTCFFISQMWIISGIVFERFLFLGMGIIFGSSAVFFMIIDESEK